MSFHRQINSSPPPRPSLAVKCSHDDSEDKAAATAASEIEAAEVLANLAKSVSSKPASSGGCGEAGHLERESMKVSSERVNVESTVAESVPFWFDLNKEVVATPEEADENTPGNEAGVDSVEVENHNQEEEEEVVGLVVATSVSSRTLPASTSQPRHDMTEDEKEARKLRRVMANRESARRSIRRRQALYEALSRKAADLAWENDKLKKDKEAALEEHRSLQCTNRNLKEQIVERLCVRRPHRGVSASGDTADVSTSVTEEQQLFACGKPSLASYMFGSRFCPLNVNLSRVDVYGMSDAAVNLLPHETYAVADFVSSPWCFPWLLPRDKHSLLQFDMKPGGSIWREPNLINNGNNTSLASSQNGGGPLVGIQSKIAVDSALGTIMRGGDAEASSSACVAGFHHESSNLERKLIDSAAAAEARKKRKELTKLKNLHHGTSRVHYGHSPC
ncbi:hypothetical protein Droror1_Dr00026305 [Drosera rotundifolia]